MPNKFIQHSAKTKMALTALGATGVFANPQIASADKVVVGSNLGNVGVQLNFKIILKLQIKVQLIPLIVNFVMFKQIHMVLFN